MRAYLANQAVLVVPQVMDTRIGEMVALGQMRPHSFKQLAPLLTESAERGRKARFHIFSRGCEQFNLFLFGQFLLAKVVNEPSICQQNTPEAVNQIVEQLEVMGAGWQECIVNNHGSACNAQPHLETIVVQLFGRTIFKVGIRIETAVSPTAGVDSDRQGLCVDGLHSIIGLTTDQRESLLDHPLDLTQIGCLTHEAGSFPEVRKPCLIIRDEIIENRFIFVEAQILPTHLKRVYLLMAERRRKTASAQRTVGYNRSILLTYQTLDTDEKMVPIHRLLSSL